MFVPSLEVIDEINVHRLCRKYNIVAGNGNMLMCESDGEIGIGNMLYNTVVMEQYYNDLYKHYLRLLQQFENMPDFNEMIYIDLQKVFTEFVRVKKYLATQNVVS